MNEYFIQMLIPVVGLVSGLIATYVSLQNRALLAEVRKEITEVEMRLIEKLNGKYVRAGECQLREAHLLERIEMVEEHARSRNAAGD